MYRAATPPFLSHSAPRGTVFTDGSPEFAFIACHGSHASLIRTHLSWFFLVLSLHRDRECVRSHDTLTIRARHIYYRRRTVEANRRPKGRSVDINLAAREKKKERKRKEKGEREGRGGYSFFLRKRGHPPTSRRTREVIYFSRSLPVLPPSLTSLLYAGPDKPTVYRRRRFNPAMTNKLST